MIRKEAVVAILGSPIAYYTAFAKVLGGVEAGILTSQFFYWYGKGHHPEGWIYKTQAEIEDETGLSRRNQETARKKLRELGVLEEQYTGMPAKLFYRLNLDKLFELMNDWFSEEALQEDVYQHGIEENTPVELQDVRIRHPRMYESAIQASANPPSKDVRIRHPSKRESAIQVSANPPSIDGGSRHSNTKTTTKTTAKSTTETTTPTSLPLITGGVDVSVGVPVSDSIIPNWIFEEFQQLLGSKRAVNAADQAALIELSAYPDHIVRQALDAARVWLRKPNQKPIHSLARWLVGTAQHKWEAEQARGGSVTSLVDEVKYSLDEGMRTWEEEPNLPDQTVRPALLTPEEQNWHTVLQELALQLPKATYDSWLRDSVVVAATDDGYEIGLPNAQAKEWLENRLAPTIRRSLASLLGHPVTIRFQVMQSQ
jgi:hypothetical protein